MINDRVFGTNWPRHAHQPLFHPATSTPGRCIRIVVIRLWIVAFLTSISTSCGWVYSPSVSSVWYPFDTLLIPGYYLPDRRGIRVKCHLLLNAQQPDLSPGSIHCAYRNPPTSSCSNRVPFLLIFFFFCCCCRWRPIRKQRRGAEEAAAHRLLGHANQSPRSRIRKEQIPVRLQTDAALQTAQTHRNAGHFPRD